MRKYVITVIFSGIALFMLFGCGSQPAFHVHEIPQGTSSQQCYITQEQSYIWLEQESEWDELPNQARDQFKHTDIDWEKDNILIVSMGKKTSAGYGVRLTGWLLEPDHWEVTEIITAPRKGSMQAMMMTSPCVLVKIPKSVKSFRLNNEQGQALGRWSY